MIDYEELFNIWEKKQDCEFLWKDSIVKKMLKEVELKSRKQALEEVEEIVRNIWTIKLDKPFGSFERALTCYEFRDKLLSKLKELNNKEVEQ